MVDWIVFYSDGSIDSTVAIDRVPTRDVQVIIQTDREAGWVSVASFDYYVWRTDINRWCGVDSFGLWDYLASPGWKRVLFGRTITSGEYDRIVGAAMRDGRLPRRTSRGRVDTTR